MLEKYIDTNVNEYLIFRDIKDNESENNIITIQIIKKSIEALKTLLDVKECKVYIKDTYLGCRYGTEYIEVLKINNNTIEIMDYNKNNELVQTKFKINDKEVISSLKRDKKTFQLLKDENGNLVPEDVIFYNNFINAVLIKF